MEEKTGEKLVFIVEDNRVFARTLKKEVSNCGARVRVFHNAVEAAFATNDELPALIFLDVLLSGPDGFTFLNEMASYPDTAKIPVVVISSLELSAFDLRDYNVVKVLAKEEMTPEDVERYVMKYAGDDK